MFRLKATEAASTNREECAEEGWIMGNIRFANETNPKWRREERMRNLREGT